MSQECCGSSQNAAARARNEAGRARNAAVEPGRLRVESGMLRVESKKASHIQFQMSFERKSPSTHGVVLPVADTCPVPVAASAADVLLYPTTVRSRAAQHNKHRW